MPNEEAPTTSGQAEQHLVHTVGRGVEGPEVADRRVFDAGPLVEKQVEADGHCDEQDADRRETEPGRRRAVRLPRIPGWLRRVGHRSPPVSWAIERAGRHTPRRPGPAAVLRAAGARPPVRTSPARYVVVCSRRSRCRLGRPRDSPRCPPGLVSGAAAEARCPCGPVCPWESARSLRKRSIAYMSCDMLVIFMCERSLLREYPGLASRAPRCLPGRHEQFGVRRHRDERSVRPGPSRLATVDIDVRVDIRPREATRPSTTPRSPSTRQRWRRGSGAEDHPAPREGELRISWNGRPAPSGSPMTSDDRFRRAGERLACVFR